MRILFVEDGLELIDEVRPFMESRYTTDFVPTSKEGIHMSLTTEYDAIVIDSNLGGKEFCLKVRAAEVEAPILLLSKKDDIEKKIRFLEQGADLFLDKPIRVRELAACINALVRRAEKMVGCGVITLGDLVVNTTTKEVWRNKCPLNLRKKEYSILELLAIRSPRTVSYGKIIENVWNDAYTLISNTLAVNIKNLRDKVDKPFNQKLIKTVRGFGYKLEV